MGSRQHANRTRRLAQAVVAALVLLTIALILLPVSRLFAPRSQPIKPTNPVTDASRSSTATELDTTNASAVLASINPRVERQRPSKTPVEQTPEQTQTPPPDQESPSQSEWVYLGSLLSSSSSYALMRSGEGQFMIARGATRDNRELVEIQPDHVVFLDKSASDQDHEPVRIRFDLLPPTGKWPEVGPGKIAASAQSSQRTPARSARPEPVSPPSRPHPTPPLANAAFASSSKLTPAQQNQVEAIIAHLSSGSFNVEAISRMYKSLGLSPEAAFDDQIAFFRNAGIEPVHAAEFVRGLIQFNMQSNPGFSSDEAEQKYLQNQEP